MKLFQIRVDRWWDHFTMSYFDNFENELLNKFKKILKNEKKIIDIFLYLQIDSVSNFMKFHQKIVKLKSLQII
jgi:hypothetical protein